MNLALAIYLVGVYVGVFGTGIGVLSDVFEDEGPRELFSNLGRRLAITVVWPLAIPVYFVLAIKRDEW